MGHRMGLSREKVVARWTQWRTDRPLNRTCRHKRGDKRWQERNRASFYELFQQLFPFVHLPDCGLVAGICSTCTQQLTTRLPVGNRKPKKKKYYQTPATHLHIIFTVRNR